MGEYDRGKRWREQNIDLARYIPLIVNTLHVAKNTWQAHLRGPKFSCIYPLYPNWQHYITASLY